MLYFPPGHGAITIECSGKARVLLLGGEPFGERILLWWNFVARTQQEMEQAVQSLAHKTRLQGERVYLCASTAVVMAVDETPDALLKRLNLALARAKPPRIQRA